MSNQRTTVLIPPPPPSGVPGMPARASHSTTATTKSASSTYKSNSPSTTPPRSPDALHARPSPPLLSLPTDVHEHAVRPERPEPALLRDANHNPPSPGRHTAAKLSVNGSSRRSSMGGYVIQPHSTHPRPSSSNPPPSDWHSGVGEPSRMRQTPGSRHADARRSRMGSRELEKTDPYVQSSHPVETAEHIYLAYSDSESEEDVRSKEQALHSHALRSVFHLTVFAFPLSALIMFYTIFAVILCTVASPFRICFRGRPTFSEQGRNFLLPPLNFEIRCIAFPTRQQISKEDPSAVAAPTSQPCANHPLATLIGKHFLSPFVALPLAILSLFTAIIWGLSAIVADEVAGGSSETERKMGTALVRAWERWLRGGAEPGDTASSHNRRGSASVSLG